MTTSDELSHRYPLLSRRARGSGEIHTSLMHLVASCNMVRRWNGRFIGLSQVALVLEEILLERARGMTLVRREIDSRTDREAILTCLAFQPDHLGRAFHRPILGSDLSGTLDENLRALRWHSMFEDLETRPFLARRWQLFFQWKNSV